MKFFAVSLIFALLAISQLALAEEEKCKDGDTKMDDDNCNQCTCGNGAWACTLKLCTECQEGQTKQEACNDCKCVNGKWGCTKKACPPVCKEGETKMEDCNNCKCASGQWACTRKACPKCADGETKKEGCNTCSCANGVWRCTLMACPTIPAEPASETDKA